MTADPSQRELTAFDARSTIRPEPGELPAQKFLRNVLNAISAVIDLHVEVARLHCAETFESCTETSDGVAIGVRHQFRGTRGGPWRIRDVAKI